MGTATRYRRSNRAEIGRKGFRPLTWDEELDRSIRILELIAAGLNNEEIGEEIGLSSCTIKEWITHKINPLLNLPNEIHTSCRRAALVALAYHKGYLKVPNNVSNGN